jgi:hypothetical protein
MRTPVGQIYRQEKGATRNQTAAPGAGLFLFWKVLLYQKQQLLRVKQQTAPVDAAASDARRRSAIAERSMAEGAGRLGKKALHPVQCVLRDAPRCAGLLLRVSVFVEN